jgi:hypothetical protein
MSHPLVGKSFVFDLDPLHIRYTFDSETQATFIVEKGGGLAPVNSYGPR